jgi:hypothetical protein
VLTEQNSKKSLILAAFSRAKVANGARGPSIYSFCSGKKARLRRGFAKRVSVR